MDKSLLIKITKRSADPSQNKAKMAITTVVEDSAHTAEAAKQTCRIAEAAGFELDQVEMIIDGGRFSLKSVLEALERSQLH